MAKLLDVAAFCFCAQSENDGIFHERDVTVIAALAGVKSPMKHVEELVAAGLWDHVGDGYAIHDFLEYNPSHAECQERRVANNKRSHLRANAFLMGRVKKRDSNRCRYCGFEVDWKDHRGPRGGTYDHVIPLSRGGDNADSNVVVCCRICNSNKGDKLTTELGIYLLEPGSLPVVEPGTTGNLPVVEPGTTGNLPVNHQSPVPSPSSLLSSGSSPLSASDPDQSNPRAKSAYDWLEFFKVRHRDKTGRFYGQGQSDGTALGNFAALLGSLPAEQRSGDWADRERIVAEFLARSDAKMQAAGWPFAFFANDFRALAIPPDKRPRVDAKPGQRQVQYDRIRP